MIVTVWLFNKQEVQTNGQLLKRCQSIKLYICLQADKHDLSDRGVGENTNPGKSATHSAFSPSTHM